MNTAMPETLLPVQEALDRGTRTLRQVLSKAGPRSIGALQTTTNEVGYLMAAARMAIEAIGGPTDATEKRLHEARLRGLDQMAALRRAAEPVLETGEVCALLGVSRETIRKKVDRRQLLALPKGGDRVFPSFQFRDGDVLPGIPEVLAALPTDSPFVVLSFLLGKEPGARGRSACERLQAGEVQAVATEARGFLSHGG